MRRLLPTAAVLALAACAHHPAQRVVRLPPAAFTAEEMTAPARAARAPQPASLLPPADPGRLPSSLLTRSAPPLDLRVPAIASSGADRSGLPPLDVVNRALDSTPLVRRAQANFDAAQAHARVLGAGPHEFALTGSYVRRRVRNEGNPPRDYDEFDVQVLRPFRLPGKRDADEEQGAFEVVAASNRLEDARHQAALELASAWYGLISAREHVALAMQALTTQQQTLHAIELQVRNQDAAALDADRAQIEQANALTALARAQGNESAALAQLSIVYPDIPTGITPTLIALDVPSDAILLRWRQRVLADSHELRAAQADLEVAVAKARRARLDRHADPSLGVRAFSERGGNELGIGVVGVVPFGSRSRGPAAEQAEAEERAFAQTLVQTRREVLVTADTDLTAARAALIAHRSAATAMESARTAVRRLTQGRRLGGVAVADLLYAQRQLHDVELAEIDSREAAARAVTKLKIDAHLLWAPPERGDDAH